MYLKSLELHGFKSFPDKTVLHFNSGNTIIVGPNGSGKSNITDAMRWVLGELSSKSLRGSKMEDVIFSGADGVRPMGYAEVSITFDNSGEHRTLPTEYDEVTVTRRYYRAGDSSYFINRKPVRLKDITELFMNTGVGREGYSIVGQGRIAEIISKKSEERRSIFEEAAGITKYRYRKNESQKKLAETEANMTRVGDIASGLESRLGPLEKDAAKARAYLEIYDSKKKLDVSLWRCDMDSLRIECDRFEAETKMSAHELEMADDTMRQLEEKIERAYEASHRNKEDSQRLRDEISAARSQKSRLENDVRLLENNSLHARRRLETEKKLRADSILTLEALEAKIKMTEERLSSLSADVAAATETITALTGRRAEALSEKSRRDLEVDRLFEERQSAEATLGDLRVRLSVLKNSISEGEERREDAGEELAGYRSELCELETKISDVSKTVAEYDARTAEETGKLEAAGKRSAQFASRQESLRRELSAHEAACEALESRISALERMLEHFEGYSNSVKYVMNESASGRLHGIHGPLSNLIKVSKEYALALETSIGAALQNIVTEDESSAKAAIAALKRAGAGRATFYPITTVKAQERGRELESAATCRGFIGFADELITCDGKYRSIVKSVVGRVCVFDNIDNASDMARARGWRVRAVTLDGQQINAGGSFTGGSARRDSGMLTRGAQIDSMKEELAGKSEESKALRRGLEEAGRGLAESERARKAAEDSRRLIESLATVERAGLSELEAKAGVLCDLISKLEEDSRRLDESRMKSEDDIARLEAEVTESERKIKELISRRERVSSERGEYDVLADELALSLSEAQVRLAELSKDKESAEAVLDEAVAQKEALTEEGKLRDGEIARLEAELEGAAARSGELTREGADKDVEIAALEERSRALDNEGDRLEEALTELRRKEKELGAKKELLFVAHTTNTNKLQSIKENIDKMTARLWDEYEYTYSTALQYLEEIGAEAVTADTRGAVNRQLTELKSRIKSLGHVNIGAIEEYAETREKYEYLRTQLDDLEASRAELEGIITELESDMRRMFKEAFTQINRNFGEVFRDLFGGGTAELSLTDPEDVLTSGIEISAAPPGKTVKSLSLLSGGEQAFIAIALMFALIKYSPSPFCIFDEIEAALDEVNVTRVANYVRRFSREMQIIMITHRRGTMDIADTLYGVTMPRRGISKVFTLDVGAVEENSRFLKDGQ